MTDSRRASTRRAVLSYDQYKDLYDSIKIALPDLLVKDYQGILQDFIFISDEVDDVESDASSSFGLISRLNSLVSEAERKIEDVDQITANLNNGFSRLEELTKRFDDLEQATSNIDNLSGQLNSKLSFDSDAGISGPESSTNDAIARFDGTSGSIIKDSLVTLSDGGILTMPAGHWTSGGININATGSGGIDIAASNTYRINGTNVLTASALGLGVTSSKLKSLGTLTSLSVTGNVNTNNNYSVDGTKVISNRGAAVTDADGSLASVTSQLNALLARLRPAGHGIIS